MSIGIYIKDATKTSIIGCSLSGLKIGVSATDSDLTIQDTSFNGVETAIKGTGNTSIDASNLTHSELPQASLQSESHWGLDATSLEIIRKFANANV